MSDPEATPRLPWEDTNDEEGPTIQEFRLSVQSLLNGHDREMLEIASEVLSGAEEGMSKTWAIDVVKDIFNRFGLEFRRSLYDGVGSVRKSITERSGGRSSEDERSTDEGLAEGEESGDDGLQSVDVPTYTFSTLDVLLEDDEKEDDEEEKDDDEEEDNPDDEGNDVNESEGEYPDWRTPPLTPAASIEDNSCIPCNLKRLSYNSQKRPISRSMPTPPTSPPNVVMALAPVALVQEKIPSPDKKETLPPPPHDHVPNSPKSFIKTIGNRLRRTSMKLRVSIVGRVPPLPSSSPGSPPPIPRRSTKRRPFAPPPNTNVSSDPHTIYGGPTLKLNRLSDVTLPLTQEERAEIARRRARASGLTEDFDLVVRLGTVRAGSRSSMAFTDGMDSLGEVPLGADVAALPEIAMVEPEFLSKGTPPVKEIERIPPRRRVSRPFSRLSRRSSFLGVRTEAPESQVVRNALSESNLRIHTARMNSQRMRIEDSILSPPPSRPGFRYRDAPTPNRRSRPRSLSPSSSLLHRKYSTGRRYPSMDYFPIAQTTTLGLRGGKIGVVQMGSASKANKILGDVVLIVPEHQLRAARKTSANRVRMMETASIPHGSISKVERLRGEKLPVEPYQRWGSMTRQTSMAKSMEQILETMEDAQKSPKQSDGRMDSSEQEQQSEEHKRKVSETKSEEIKRSPSENMRSSTELWRSASLRSTAENKSSVSFTLPSSVDGRKSSSDAKRGETDQRASANVSRRRSNGAVWIL